MSWIEEQRALMAMLRLVGVLRGASGPFPGWILVTPGDVETELPFTPRCRHLNPHAARPIETEEALVNYLVFKQLGWEQAGYCWSYVPAFLHEWFGCGPGAR